MRPDFVYIACDACEDDDDGGDDDDDGGDDGDDDDDDNADDDVYTHVRVKTFTIWCFAWQVSQARLQAGKAVLDGHDAEQRVLGKVVFS